MANLTNNRIDLVVKDAEITAVKDAMQTINDQLPFLIGLTIEERESLNAIDVDNKIFAEDAFNSGLNNPDMLSKYISVEAMQSDLTLFDQLDELVGMAKQLLEKLEDTKLLAGSEAYTSALSLYKMFIGAADAGVPGADSIVQLLRQRFTSKGNKPLNPPTNPEL